MGSKYQVYQSQGYIRRFMVLLLGGKMAVGLCGRTSSWIMYENEQVSLCCMADAWCCEHCVDLIRIRRVADLLQQHQHIMEAAGMKLKTPT